ncbi:hypothetical protein JKG47_22790, partial [Acidithiobacillus sp. MC6.1]|nr:hypothetical protein [Acidithiobacillus sp. MC6.1]
MVSGLRWFRSVIGVSFNGDNRTLSDGDMGSGDLGSSAASPDAVFLWGLQEWAMANRDAKMILKMGRMVAADLPHGRPARITAYSYT